MPCNLNGGCPCGNFLGNVSRALNNLFPTPCNGCGNNNNNGGCGCNNNNNGGCGCNNNNNNGGCGCNNNNPAVPAGILNLFPTTGTNCNCPYDDYYARQYALYPYNLPTVRCCCN